MKKVLLSALAIAGLTIGANAQANSVLLYGNLGIGSETSAAKDHHFNFGINPGIGYQFDNHWTAGLTGGFNTVRDRADIANDWNYDNTYSIAPFIRYTQGLGKIFAVYTQFEIGYTGGQSGITNTSSSKVNYNGLYSSLTPYVGINVSRGFALNFQFGGVNFESTKFKGANNSDNSFGLTFGRQFSVGISKNIGGRGAKAGCCSGGTTHGSHHVNTDDADDSDSAE